MELIVNILGKLIAAAFVSVIYFALKEAKSFLITKKEEVQDERLRMLIESFVEAAEQLLKDADPTGEKRKQYVEQNLEQLGYVITSEINAQIEACVFDINNI